MLESAISSAQTPNSAEGNWVEILPARTYHTPNYGRVPVEPVKLETMVKNFSGRVRGQDIAINFDHGMDRAKGNQAAGWFKELAVKPSSANPSEQALWAQIDWTPDAMSELKDKKWKYMSLEWDDEWMANDGSVHNDVVVGAALTNRPVAKNMMPVNFSEELWNELDTETQKKFAVWSTAYVNSLPDSSFLYIEKEAGEAGDSESKKENRHLPYKDASGKVDLPHLRNAIARIPQMKGVSDSLKTSLQSKARAILAARSKNMSEEVQAAVVVLEKEGLDIIASTPDWGRQDPGVDAPIIGNPEQPDPGVKEYIVRVSGDPTTEELDIGSGSRREALPLDPDDPAAPNPNNEQGGDPKVTPEELKKFFDDLIKHVSETDKMAVTNAFSESVESGDSDKVGQQLAKVFGEWAALKANEYKDDEEKRFAEQFPRAFREQQALLSESRENKAKSFSESVSTVKRTEGDKLVPTTTNLSALALDTIANAHKAFSEGRGTVATFEEVVKVITDGGLVPGGESGSGRAAELVGVDLTSLVGVNAGKVAFSEKVNEIMMEDGFKDMPGSTGRRAAIAEASKRHPELAEAYNHTPISQPQVT